MFKLNLLLMVMLLVSSSALAPAVKAQRQETRSVSELWLDISLGPPLVEWFDQVAGPGDIARVEHPEQIDLLDSITVGQKLVVFKSAAEAEQLIPTIADRIDIVGYNLEQGLANPADEQADPVGSAQRMRALAQQYGLKLAFGPDHDLALSDGPAIAPYVDIFVLQVQRVQTEPDTVQDFVLPLVPRLRQANPELEISVQIRTEGDVVELVDLVDSIKTSLDGVSILTSPETMETAMALVTELQTRTTTTTIPQAVPTLSVAEVAPATIQSIRPTWWHVVGALVAGAVGGAATSTLLCWANNKINAKQPYDYE
ncbi:MAG TPA: hypothetical protein VF177_18935 [Anaerolineae bacterium]